MRTIPRWTSSAWLMRHDFCTVPSSLFLRKKTFPARLFLGVSRVHACPAPIARCFSVLPCRRKRARVVFLLPAEIHSAVRINVSRPSHVYRRCALGSVPHRDLITEPLPSRITLLHWRVRSFQIWDTGNAGNTTRSSAGVCDIVRAGEGACVECGARITLSLCGCTPLVPFCRRNCYVSVRPSLQCFIYTVWVAIYTERRSV